MGNSLEFQAWECVSLLRKNANTLDFVIKEEASMMSLLVATSRIIYGNSKDTSFRSIYTQLKFKMKLSYHCWQKQVDLKEIFFEAIQKTLEENLMIAVKELQDFLQNKDGVPFLNNYSEESERSQTKQE